MKKHLQQFGWPILLVGTLSLLLSACGRDYPPGIPPFVPPEEEIIEDVPFEAPTEQVVEAPPAEKPKPEPEPKPKPKPAQVEAPPPPPPPEPQEEQAPSIIGSWQVTEMSRNGQTMPMPEQMKMVFSFSEDGTFSLSMSGGPDGQTHTQEGSYTLSGDQLSITREEKTKTATVTFEGSNKMTLEVEGEVTMILSRT